ncbi:MAG: hypothetical protein OXC72_06475 [Roseovarius sp.]|nr:hypothetical protein [Roseovarius sp.]
MSLLGIQAGGPPDRGAIDGQVGEEHRGGKRRIAVDVEGFPISMAVHESSVRDGDGAPWGILDMPAKAPGAQRPRADGGHAGGGPESASKYPGIDKLLETIKKPKDLKVFTVPCRRHVVERTFAWSAKP